MTAPVAVAHDDEEACAICLRRIHALWPLKVCTLACHHRFCVTCIVPWFDTATTCPVCRRDIASRPRAAIIGMAMQLVTLEATHSALAVLLTRDGKARRASAAAPPKTPWEYWMDLSALPPNRQHAWSMIYLAWVMCIAGGTYSVVARLVGLY